MPTRRLPAVIVGAFVAALVSMPGTASAYTARVETNPVSGIKFLHVFTSTATVTADSFEAEDVGGNEVKITGRDAAIAGSGCTPSGRSVTCDAGAVVQVDVFAGNDRVIIDSAPQPVVVFAGTGDDEIRVDQATVNTDVFAFATGILGEEGDDLIIGSTGPDFFDGRDGDDVLVGKGGDDSINGDVGGDVMSGGTGVDQVTYLEGTDTGRDLGITVHVGDGICNDGSAEDDAVGNRAPVSRDVTSTCGNGNAVERDEVLGDVESLLGTNGDDSIIGNSSSGTIVGLAGEDLLEGAGGADSVLGEGSIPAGFFGGQPPDGDDTLLLRDGVTDFSSFCGGGSADRAVADPGDPVSFDCETVERGAAGVTGPATDGLAPPVVVGGAPDPNAPQQPQPVTSPPPPPGTPPTGNDAGGGEPGGGDGGATAPDVRIFGDTLIVDRKRRAQVRITCVYRAEECEGTAELTATKDIGKGRKGFDRGDRVGRTEISIPWGRTGKVPVKVSKDFFAALGEDSTKLKLSVEARDSGAGRNAAVARVSRKMTTAGRVTFGSWAPRTSTSRSSAPAAPGRRRRSRSPGRGGASSRLTGAPFPPTPSRPISSSPATSPRSSALGRSSGSRSSAHPGTTRAGWRRRGSGFRRTTPSRTGSDTDRVCGGPASTWRWSRPLARRGPRSANGSRSPTSSATRRAASPACAGRTATGTRARSALGW